jgi:hypothetical protein
MHDAVQAIGRAAGISGLTPNANGVFELVINKVLPVYFQEVGEAELEVQVRLDELESRLDSAMIDALLAANTTTRAGRFALEPNSNKVVFGGRLNISAYDKDSLLRAVDAIIVEAANWKLDGENQLRAMHSGSQDVMSETLIRV